MRRRVDVTRKQVYAASKDVHKTDAESEGLKLPPVSALEDGPSSSEPADEPCASCSSYGNSLAATIEKAGEGECGGATVADATSLPRLAESTNQPDDLSGDVAVELSNP